MTMESIPPANNKLLQTESVKLKDKNIKPLTKCATSDLNLDIDAKQAIDHATGLLQTIVTDKISDKIIRKIPSDEYLHLLHLLDGIISGSIDKHI
ncbi:flagellar protein FlaG [Fluoribacter dumoffii]|uniref:FlaG protein n=1 Tax=Fluoribacter dumoffii TaxID=463 RepID=A0A377G8V0_9GAMM|nr:flagellar protein FlaG [Fluoribacter dumoffii]KTC90046.1 hypothetical protein Ldum_1114 [Fluoribacter dumoffii NY 23]MCW8385345.1 flagellar protein FlaG [Fluoribacter dumoffii]MCW8418398.1 flagellar protein FlaG [Fluoribacter dumoffii]MCW8453760.1 flagellar protein FlaG [Fluoribacter dumoffii]MCW8462169.1 flagellar protein FlaG [Fluoribacter dumoffii]